MGYVLLWIESLAVSLLLVATLVACLAQLGPRRRRWTLWAAAILIALVPLAIYAALASLAAVLYYRNMAGGLLFLAMVKLAVAYGLGALWLLVRGLRPQPEPALIRAGAWPRGRLAVALLIAVALHLMTFWNMDLTARQQLATLRTEAGALALSVAPARLPDRDNAAIVYQQACEAMGLDETAPGGSTWEKKWQDAWREKWTMRQNSEKIGFDPHDPELRRFLKRQSAALALLRQAAAKPGCFFDRDYAHPSIEMLLPEIQPIRSEASLLRLDAICRASDKDYRGAIEDINAMFRTAEHISSEPIIISQLVAIAINASAIDTLHQVMASGQAPLEDLAAIHLPDGRLFRASLRRAFRMEQAFDLATMEQLGNGQTELRVIVGNGFGFPAVPPMLIPIYRVFLLGDDIEAQARFYARAYRLPYSQAKLVNQELQAHPGGVLTAFLLPAVARTTDAAVRAEAMCDVARVGLAVCAYRARNKKLPDTLDDLAPDFIPAVPRDPFDGQPLKMKRIGQGAVVYSIGPDMVDNGGVPFDWQKQTGDIIFTAP